MAGGSSPARSAGIGTLPLMEAPGTPAAGPRSKDDARAATGAFLLLAAAALAWWMWLGRGTTFLYDEWDFVQAFNKPFWQAVIAPHNGQFNPIPVMVYRAMFALVGIGRYWPYRLVGMLFELSMLGVTFAYLRKRLPALIALAAVALLMANGQAWQDILWPFELTFTISLGAGVGALMLLDRNDRAGNIGAAAALVVSVGSCGFGLMFLAAVAVDAIWSTLAKGRRHQARDDALAPVRSGGAERLWVVVPGLAIYLAWYVQAHVHDAALSRLHDLPSYLAQSAGYGTGSLFGSHGLLPGELLTALLAVMVILRLAWGWRSAARLAAVIAAALTFWTLAALARAGVAGPETSRYLQPDNLFVLMALAELGAGRWSGAPSGAGAAQTPAAQRAVAPQPSVQPVAISGPVAEAEVATAPRRGVSAELARISLLAAAIIVVLAVASNSDSLVSASRGLRGVATLVRGDLRAVEIAGTDLPSDLQPLPADAPQIFVGRYLAAAAALGSPADSNIQLLAAPDAVRQSADSLLIKALRLSLTRARPRAGSTAGQPPPGCSATLLSIPGVGTGGAVVVRLRHTGLIVSAPAGGSVQLRLRLLASQFPQRPSLTVPAGDSERIAPTASLKGLPASPWWVQLKLVGMGSATACSAS